MAFSKEGSGDTDTPGGGHVMTEAKIRIGQPQAKQCHGRWQYPKLGRGEDLGFYPEYQTKHGLADTSILNLEPPEL